MQLLHEVVLVQQRPERPDLVKHDDQQTTRFLFPIYQFAEQPARITNSIKTVSAVLQKHSTTTLGQLFAERPPASRNRLDTIPSRGRTARNKKAHRPATAPFLHHTPGVISDPTGASTQLRANDDDLLAHALKSFSGQSAAMRLAITGQSAFFSYQFASAALLLASSVAGIISTSSAPTVDESGVAAARGPLRTIGQ